MNYSLSCKEPALLVLGLTVVAGCGPLSTNAGDVLRVGQPEQTCAQRIDLKQYLLELSGADLDAHEGLAAHVKTTMPLATEADHSCSASASALVRQGGFALQLANHTDTSAYPFILGYFDVDANGACDVGIDSSWGYVGSVNAGATLRITVDPPRLNISHYKDDCYGFINEASF